MEALDHLAGSNKLVARVSSMLTPLSPTQHVAVASASCFFLFTIVSDLTAIVLAPVVPVKTWVFRFPFGLAATCAGVILPCYSDWGEVTLKDGRVVDAEICLCD